MMLYQRRSASSSFNPLQAAIASVFLVLLLMVATTANAENTNVLFLGNSYTFYSGGLDQLVKGLLESPENNGLFDTVRANRHASGGKQLHQHRDDANNSADNNNQLRKWLVSDQPLTAWNWVIMQEQSQIPGFGSTDSTYVASKQAAVQLNNHIKKIPSAQTVFLMTWGRRTFDKHNPELYPDFLTMNSRLQTGYEGYVKATSTSTRKTRAAPVGPAFEYIYRDVIAKGGNPLATDSEFYRLYSDGSHPSLSGSYLAACVLYMTMTGKDPRGLSYKPGTLSSEAQARLQQVAYITVRDYNASINNKPPSKVKAAAHPKYMYKRKSQIIRVNVYNQNGALFKGSIPVKLITTGTGSSKIIDNKISSKGYFKLQYTAGAKAKNAVIKAKFGSGTPNAKTIKITTIQVYTTALSHCQRVVQQKCRCNVAIRKKKACVRGKAKSSLCFGPKRDGSTTKLNRFVTKIFNSYQNNYC